MNRFTQAERLMTEALAIIQGDRQQAYGPPDENYRRIGLMWTAYLQANGIDANVTPIMAVHMHDLGKLCRLIQTPNHEDTLRDRFGYAACNVALVMPDEAPFVWGDTTATWTVWPPAEDDLDHGMLRTPAAAE